ncbi:MAG TPA: hypothetical protein PLG21_20100 [Anaerolineae bacterium]|nr:hypothetical protein [Anaerolineae bacterium]
MMDLILTPPPAGPAVPARMGYRARRRYYQAMDRHPLAGLPLGPGGRRCGECAHHYVRTWGDARYHKCEEYADTAGPATDICVGWPACERFEEERSK